MSRLRTVALCLIAMFAIGAVSAASASALPEFTGPFPKPFSSTSKTSILETVGKTKVKCTADTNAGEVTGPTTGLVRIRFTGCESKTFPCNSPGAAAGEIVTTVLSGILGYVNRETKEVGLDLSNPAGALLAEFQCVNLRFAVRGSVIGKVTPVNKPVIPPSRFIVKFVQKAGKQSIMKLAGGPVDILETSVNGGPFEPSGLSSTDALLFKEPVVINA
jgi:hypothetical protein